MASFFTHAILKEALTAGDGSIDRVMHPLISHNDLARRPRGRPAGAPRQVITRCVNIVRSGDSRLYEE